MRKWTRTLLAVLLLFSITLTAAAQSVLVEDPTDILVLVNRHNRLPSDFWPDDLLPVGGGQFMRERAANAFLDMQRSMNQAGLYLNVRSGFRCYETQRLLFNNAVRNWGQTQAERWVARPGHSEHQTGLAVDVVQRGFTGSPLSSARFQTTRQFAWLTQYAHTYGFIMRYPGEYEHITGFAFEPWHWRYIGVESATYMREHGFAVFETYIEHRATRGNAPSDWARELVDAAIAAGLVPESLQSHYTQAATRAEFATLAVTLYEHIHGEITGRATFTDTDDIHVQKAAYVGIVQGVGDNRFAPTDSLTREQAAVMLARLADAAGSPFPHGPLGFADRDSISDWATESVTRVHTAGIMLGVADNNFAPQDSFTREQSIVTMMRLLEFHKTAFHASL